MGDQVCDLRFTARVEAVGRLTPETGEDVLDAAGGEVLPGLHDHHIHLMALARLRQSIDLTGVTNLTMLREALATDPGEGWLRCVNYHESTLGALDRHILDALEPERPVRVQHASGKLWVLNSTAALATGLDECQLEGVERDDAGQPTGRLFRLDGWLRAQISSDLPDLAALGRELARHGITSVTDTSYTNTPDSVERLRRGLPQKVFCMGDASLSAGHLKVMLDEDRLPDIEELTAAIAAAHAADRGVAFHCVSHVELVFALTALHAAGEHPRDRIEHAAVVRPEAVPLLVDSGCTVVTQPGFLYARGERYRREVEAADLPYLYPYARLLASGIPVAASSDAPYGPVNPWQVIASAVARRTRDGAVLGATECVSADEALRGYLSDPLDPGGAARELSVGTPADMVLLNAPWRELRQGPLDAAARATYIDGRCVYESSAST